MAGEGERLRVEGREAQVDAPLAVHLHRVEQIVLIIIRSYLGKGADESLQEERAVVYEQVHLAESLLQKLLHAVS